MADDDAPEGDPTNDSTATDSPTAGKQQEPDKTFTQAELDKLISDRLERERKKFAGHDEMKAKAARFDELEAAKKTNEERLNEQLAAREVELQELRVERVRQQAGKDAKLDPDLWEFITAAEPEAALAQAKKLAVLAAVPEPGPANMRQGSRAPAKQAPSPNDALRAMLGYPQ